MQRNRAAKPVFLSDLGRVLVTLDYSRYHETLLRATQQEPDRFEENYRLFMEKEYRLLETGLIPENEFFDRLMEEMALGSLGRAELKAAWNGILSPDPVMPAFLKRLRDTGEIELVLLSNTNTSHLSFCRETIPELSAFDRLVLSNEVRSMKPDPAIYRAAVAPYPEGTPFFFIDDLEENIRGAAREGIPGLVFRGYGDFIESAAAVPVFGPLIQKAAADAAKEQKNGTRS